jgi:hypothetical protein
VSLLRLVGGDHRVAGGEDVRDQPLRRGLAGAPGDGDQRHSGLPAAVQARGQVERPANRRAQALATVEHPEPDAVRERFEPARPDRALPRAGRSAHHRRLGVKPEDR